MSVAEFIIIFTLIAVIFYWIDTIRTKELAVMHGKNACKDAGITFLDQTVEIKKVRLKRNPRGSMVFYREYQFEFSSDGVRRVDAKIIMLGKQLLKLQLSAYPEIIQANPDDLKPDSEQSSATIEAKVVEIKSPKNR
ncbi:hypothetical protein MNBD_GAMMA23-1445 [hydrothermal vent metagenome]|uniref:DUF3301 domain-containing protein n=1 Tax=hydrothermal vent metagenome TaxID=652676 RepID=A0A3B0ZCX2_9ZZZZ